MLMGFGNLLAEVMLLALNSFVGIVLLAAHAFDYALTHIDFFSVGHLFNVPQWRQTHIAHEHSLSHVRSYGDRPHGHNHREGRLNT